MEKKINLLMQRIILFVLAITITLIIILQVVHSIRSNSKLQMFKTRNTMIENRKLTINTFYHDITYKDIPNKVVSLNAHTTEMLLALGLSKLLVGTAYNNAPVLPRFNKEFNKIPQLADKYPTLEVLLSVNPDFVFGRSSAFTEKSVAPIQTILDNGIKTYVCKGSYTSGATIEDTYEDFYNLGKIFQIEKKADAIINTMKNRIELVQDKVKDKTAIKVFVLDSGGDTAFTACQSLQTNLMELAGGKNIFADIEKTWSRVSWEEVVARDPEIIVVNDYGNTPAAQKIEEVRSNPALQEVSAIKNNNFFVIELPAVFPGIRNADTVERFAQAFHPDVYKK